MATGCIFDQAPLTSSETVLEVQAAKPGVCRTKDCRPAVESPPGAERQGLRPHPCLSGCVAGRIPRPASPHTIAAMTRASTPATHSAEAKPLAKLAGAALARNSFAAGVKCLVE